MGLGFKDGQQDDKMKRRIHAIVLGLAILSFTVALVIVIGRLWSTSENRPLANGTRDGASTPAAPDARQQDIRGIHPSTLERPANTPPIGDTALARLLTSDVNLSDQERTDFSKYLERFRGDVCMEFARAATIERVSLNTVRLTVSLPLERSQELRRTLYLGLTEIVGEDRFAQILRGHARDIDGEYDNFGEIPFVFTATCDTGTTPHVVVQFQTESRRDIAGAMFNRTKSGTLLIPDFLERYGALGDRALGN